MTRLPLLQLLSFTVWTLLCATCAYGFGGEFHGVPRRVGDTSLTLTGNSPWVVNVTAEPTAVQMALRDVQRDFYKALGYAPVVLATPPSPGSYDPLLPVLYLGTPEAQPWLAHFNLAGSGCTAGFEAHCLIVGDDAVLGRGGSAIVATGADVRGAIFGAYALSEELLGVDPWYQWTDNPTPYVGSITVPTGYTAFPVPAYKYRAWFSNDEDLNGNFHPSPVGETVFDLATFDRFFETMLRNKGNMFLVGTVPLPDEKSIALASRRGLVIIQHHFNLLGNDVFRWPQQLGKAGWDWQTNADYMGYAWKGCVAAQADYEVAWSVGLRGLNDYSYPCANPKECGRLISEAMGNETEWVRAVQPNATVVTYLWDEELGYLKEGVLTLPEGVDIMFSDEGAGFIHGNDTLFSEYASGIYYHTAMYNGQANQLTEMVPVTRIFSQMGHFTKVAKTTKYFVDNISDLRPVVMTTDAITRFVYNPKPYMGADVNATAAAYRLDWATRQYGSTVAQQVADLWGDYFQVPYIAAGMGDNHLGTAIKDLAAAFTHDLNTSGKVSAQTVHDAQELYPVSLPIVSALLARAQALLPHIPSRRVSFFTGHVLLQHSIQAYGCGALAALCHAVEASSNGNSAGAAANVTASMKQLDLLFAAERAAEYGQWHGLYMYDRLVDFQRAYTLVRQAGAVVSKASFIPPARPSSYYEFYDYQIIPARANYPYLYKSDTWNVPEYVKIGCNPCDNATDSARYHKGSNPMVTLSCLLPPPVTGGSLELRYTTDGSQPSSSSPLYRAPIAMSELSPSGAAVTVKARAFFADSDSAEAAPTVVSSVVFEQYSA